MRTEVWLYGSVARGTHSSQSDLDILAVPRGAGVRTEFIAELVADLPQSQFCSVASYSWEELRRMSKYGSLFLLHLRMEGRLLAGWGEGTGLEKLLADLPNYSRKARELQGFAVALSDGVESVQDGGELGFEIGIAGRVIRHASILTSYLADRPCFDRDPSIRTAFADVGMEADADRAVAITTELRRRDAPPFATPPSREEVLGMFELAQRFVEGVTRKYAAA